MSKRDQFEVIEPRNLPKIGAVKHKVGGSKLKLMGQPHPRNCIRNSIRVCTYVAEYLHCRASGAKYGTRWAAVAPIYD